MGLTHLSDDNPPGDKNQARPRFDWPALRKHIEFYEREGLCYLPAGWGRKNPSLKEWEQYQTRLPTKEEKVEWFHEGRAINIGAVCGGVSGGLVILCFNDPDGAAEFFGEERWHKLPQATFVTKSARGHHVWLRSDSPIKSQKVGKGKNESWLEIRSDGNFTVAPPSLHPSGELYQAVGVDHIYKPDDLASFITRRLVELGLREALQAKEVTGRRKKHPPCLETISQGVDEQQRKDAALALAKHYLIQFYKPGEVFWLLQEWDTKNKPPSYDKIFLENTVKSAEEYRGFFCSLIKDKPAISTFCVGEEKCHWPKPKKLEEKPRAKEKPERSDEFNELAIEQLLENCPFMQHCRDDADTLSEPDWFSECDIFSFFGEPGRGKAHELSQPYRKYTREETDKKLEYAKEAKDKAIGPHTCAHIEKDLGFACPEDCLAKEWNLKSPVVLATRLARTAGVPTIVCSGRHLREESADALQALYQANTPERIFYRGGTLCRINKDELNRPMIELLIEAALRGHMERSANFIKYNAKGEAFVAPPPLEIVRDVQSLGDWQFPALLGITEAPIIRPDGTVLATPGYDSATDLYYAPTPGLVVSPIPENPTDSEVRAATELLLEVICDFPFVDEASHANAVGALMVAILRPLMGLAPMAVLDKPQPGTGASLLADVISIVATGRPAATMGEPRSEEECEKKLNSHLLEGRSLCIIDNVDGKLWSDTLARFLTSPYLSVRPLGRSADLRLRNSLTYVVTGNNIQLGGDLPRRCFWVRLNAQLARPWLRDGFRHPRLPEWLAENRGAILAAVLTIARAWVVAGRPENPELLVLGGYEDFCCVVGNILDFMGVKGFLANLTTMYDTMDKDTPQWEAFLETWREVIGDVPVTVKELIKKLDDFEELSNSLPEGLATRDERNYSRRLGNALAKRAEVYHPNGMVLVKAGTRHRASLWGVIQKIANSPGFSFKSELGELGSTLPHTEKSEGKNIYIERVGANSPNSPLATKRGELAEDIGAVDHRDPWDEFLEGVEGKSDE